MVMPSPRLPGLNGLKLQFHCVPCSFEIVSVPLGPLPALAPPPDDPEGEEEELQAASAAASSAAAPVMSKRLIGVPPLGVSRRMYPWCCRDVWALCEFCRLCDIVRTVS